METLLIATDFSSAAQNSLFYGLELAKDTGAEIVLLHVYQTVISSSEHWAVVDDDMEQKINERLLREVKSLPFHHHIPIRVRSHPGKPSEVIMQVAEEVNAKLIVVGMKGSGQTTRRLFGSTAVSLSKFANRPVLVIPEESWYADLKYIALAGDLDEETDEHVLDPLKELGSKFHSKLFIVKVVEAKENEIVDRIWKPSRVRRYLKELSPSFEFVKDNEVVDGLNRFVEDYSIDMVVMVAREHTFLEQILLKNDVKEMLFRSEVPVLILPHKVMNDEYLVEELELAEFEMA